MTRKKIKLSYISNDTARKATFKKRKRGLLKKVSELSTLCGIEACAIIFSPYTSQPDIWPSPLGVQRVLTHFKNLPELEQSKKMVNQETFLRQRIAKASEQLKKQQRDNREKEMTEVMFRSLLGRGLDRLNVMDLNDLGWLIDQNIMEISQRMEILKHAAENQAQVPPYVPYRADGFNQTTEEVQMAAEKPAVESSVDSVQMEPWLTALAGPPNNIKYITDDMIHPFDDENPSALWSDSFFP